MPDRRRTRLDRSLYRQPGRVYSITSCTRHRAPLFRNLTFARRCIEALRKLSELYGVKVHAYCLMPDHVHLLLQPVRTVDICCFVGAWKSTCYALAKADGRPQRIWQRSFHDHVLRRDEGVRATAEYILANPVRAGLVKDPRQYELSGSFEFDI